MVIVQNMTDLSQTSRFILESRSGRVGMGSTTSLTMYDRGLATVIGKNRDSSGALLSNKTKFDFDRLRLWDQRSKGRKFATLGKAFTLLHAMKTKLGIPDSTMENAAYIYRKAMVAKLTRGRSTRALVGAALYAACRTNNTPRTLKDIAGAGNIERNILSKTFRTMSQKLELELGQYDTTSFITKISNDMNLKEKIKRDGFDILKRCKVRGITAGKNPMAQAAASLYIACLINNEKTSQKKFSLASGISDVTIRNRVSLIKKTIHMPE